MKGQVVIVGAGVAGLVLADRLSEAGVRTVLIEVEAGVGGLARSFRYPNSTVFDIGPHRFHTDDPRVQAYIEALLGGNIVTIDRTSQLYLFGKYLPWPITLKNVLALPPPMMVRAGLDLLFPRRARTDSFEDYIIANYGRTLYRAFFKPYTEKFLDYSCSNLHRDWAEAGINRATIDKQIKTEKKLTAWQEFCQQKRLGGAVSFAEIAQMWKKQKDNKTPNQSVHQIADKSGSR